MFDRKLMKYKDIIGFAYEVRYREDFRYYSSIYTYLVIYDNGVKFVKNKKYKCVTNVNHAEKLAELASNGYETLDKWTKEVRKNLLNNRVLKKEFEGDKNEKNNNN